MNNKGVCVKLITVQDLWKSYQEAGGRLEVIRGVNLEMEPGEMLAITGESGSGKSTLLHLLGMLDSADRGEIYYQNRLVSLRDRNIHRFRNQTVGFVFQFHYLLEDFTARENAAMPLLLASGDLQTSLREADILLQALDMYPRREHYPNQLSGGEQQRVAVARALINKPAIVLADEPTGNLDARHSEELVELILELNRGRGQSFIIATHNRDIARRMHRHLHLENGVLQPFQN